MSAGEPRARATVLVLTPDLSTIGGVESYYNALDLERHDNRIEFFFVNTASRESLVKTIIRLLHNYWRFWWKLRTRQYRLVLINPSLNPNSYYRDSIFCCLALLQKLRVLVFFRGWSDEMELQIRQKPIQRTIFKLGFSRVKRFIVLSNTFKERLIAMGCRRDSRFWIETTVADTTGLAEFSIISRLRESPPLRILFLSRFVLSKGPKIALRAFHLAQKNLGAMEIELIMAGDGPALNETKMLAERACISNVRFPGVVRGDDRKKLLLSSQILLFPTWHDEGMPNVILEAMLYGLAVLSRPVGGIPDVVVHRENGLLTGSLDPQVFADCIVELATTPTLRYRMAIANHEKASTLYVSSAVRARLIRIIDATLASDVT